MEMVIGDVIVFRVMKRLYGILNSGLHWCLTYLDHHWTLLGMLRSSVGPCVLIKKDGNILVGVIYLQVDDIFGFCQKDFLLSQ